MRNSTPLLLLSSPLLLCGALLAQQDSKELAGKLLDRLGFQRGLCVVLGSDGDLPLQLVRSSGLLVHVRDPRSAAVKKLREQVDNAGFDIRRLAVERGRTDALPHADNLVDAVIVTNAGAEILRKLSAAEVLRALRPEGTAIVGDSGGKRAGIDKAKLEAWASASKARRVSAWTDATGTWVQFHKAPLAGADSWTHWEHGPDNNPVSTDSVIKAPYLTQFLATPYYIGMPSITTAAGGRTFLAIGHIAHHRREWSTLNKLIARNGYNGTVLWERKLPETYLVHRSAFIATRDTFYMIDGDGALLLDPRTGKEIGEVRFPGVDGAWKWMVLQGDVLYALAGKPEPGTKVTKGDRTFGGWSWADLSPGYYGKRIPFGFGDTLAAYDLGKKRLLWKHKEKGLIDSRGMAMLNGRLYLYCPDLHLRCLDAKIGKVLWTNKDDRVVHLIEKPGRGLTSTPGWRTSCITLATPEALIIQGQTRMNVVAVSPADGSFLWTKKKISNNPNAIYADGNIVIGLGPRASHLVLEPESGVVQTDLKFGKQACTRLTASPDSFFCRGEGTLRFDRATGKVLIDGGVRPACNDGVIPANGMLYIGPWQCDCNLSLIGHLGRCSVGTFRFDKFAPMAERLQIGGVEETDHKIAGVASLRVSDKDWPTYRGNTERSAGTSVRVPANLVRRWTRLPHRSHVPTAPISAGGLVFVAGENGKVRALDAGSGAPRWEFSTSSPIKAPPTIADGRAYFGSCDGHVYAVEAATGRLLWRFQAAPVERYIMVYGTLSSTWPVNSGVLVEDGVAYFAAGILDSDGTHVYALDAKTGKVRWQNNTCGHLNKELRKGVSAQGNLTILGGQLLLAGGNQVSPARFDLETGRCLNKGFQQGRPKANHGSFVGVFAGKTVLAGGRILYSSPRNVASKGHFDALQHGRRYPLHFGGIPPAWDDKTIALVNTRYGKLTCCDAPKAAAAIAEKLANKGRRRRTLLVDALRPAGAIRWQADLSTSTTLEVVSLAVCPNAVVAAIRYQQKTRAKPQWFLAGFEVKTLGVKFRIELRREPLPGGILIDRDGQVVLTMLDGTVLCFGARN